MPNNRLEALLQGIDDGGQLEQLVSDLLRREGYNVDPTGTRGPDGGRDAFLERGGVKGVLHCSIQPIEKKIKSDAKKAAERPEDFGQFIFATTDSPAAVKRDRLEREIGDKYGWQVRIYDLERLRNQLHGNTANHDLIREHLHVDPSDADQNARTNAEEFYEQRLDALRSLEGYPGQITSGDDDSDNISSSIPFLAIHIIPEEAFSSSNDRLAADFPEPPFFGRHHGWSEVFGNYVMSSRQTETDQNSPYESYVAIHEDGWSEAVTTEIAARMTGELNPAIDQEVVEHIEKMVDWYQQVGVKLPLYIYTTLFHAEDCEMYTPFRIMGPDRPRPIGETVFRLGDVTMNSYDDDIPQLLRKPLYRLWSQTGWKTGSRNYSEVPDEESGDASYEWDPV